MTYDVIVIGAGVAGLTSSIYAASRGMKVLVLEQEGKGGVIGKVSTITHFPGIHNGESGRDYYDRLMEQVKTYDIEIRLEKVLRVDLKNEIKSVTTNERPYQAKSVIIANGTTPNRLGIPGENRYEHKGVSFCALEDAPKYAGKRVCIVGGSDGAIKEALFIGKYASEVHVIHFEDSLTAVAEFQKPLLADSKFIIHLHSRVAGLEGSDERLEKVIIRDEHDEKILDITGDDICLFIYIGGAPNYELVDGQLELENHFIKTDELMRTSVPGVYAAGDIRAKAVRQVATAANDGAIAAIQAFAYVKSLQ